jgi:hypothetical protein
MPYFARLWGRDLRRRPAHARYEIEALEGRTMLSGAGSSVAGSQASVVSTTLLQSTLSTAVTGAKIVFTAEPQNAATGQAITSGKINFVVQAPKKIVLGDVKVNSQGVAGVSTTALTSIGDYRVEAQYTPSNSGITASVATPVKVKVVAVPLNVPTTTTISSGTASVEGGQYVSLTATVKDAGTGDQVNAGLVEPMTGSVAFLTVSANPIVLGEANLNSSGQAALSSDMLKLAGQYQIEAEYLPANNYYAESTSVPTPVTITPPTLNAPTVTSITAMASSIETGEPIGFTVSVQNPDSSLADGVIQIVTVSRHPQVLGAVGVNSFGQSASFVSSKLTKVGSYQVEAEYIPNTNRFAESTSVPVPVTVTPLTAASFRVTPLVRHGRLSKPASFSVTALDAQKQPLKNYTGTVEFSSPTDSWTIFPAAEYRSLNTAAPSLQSPGLADFNPQSYTFTAADQGTHTFVGAVTFGKGGAESVQVTQADNPKVIGKATFAIG